MFKRVGDAVEQLQRALDRQRPIRREVAGEVATVAKLHDDVGRAVGKGAVVVNLHHALSPNNGRYARFLLKPQESRARVGVQHRFHGLEGVGQRVVLEAVNRAHAALAKFLVDDVIADGATHDGIAGKRGLLTHDWMVPTRPCLKPKVQYAPNDQALDLPATGAGACDKTPRERLFRPYSRRRGVPPLIMDQTHIGMSWALPVTTR